MNKLSLIFFMVLLASVVTFGQATSGVTGVVTDASGALVPGVQVTLTDTKTSREQTTTTNEQGTYTFTNIPPGAGYRLSFSAQGFQTFVLSDVALGIGRTETHNAQLTAGQVAETVQVTSTAGEATLNTTDASIGNVISERQIRELPIQLRDNPAALIGLQPGVIGDNVGTGNVNRVGSVAGSRADQGNITVDGIDSNDVATGQAFVTVGNLPIDSVQEFRAVTANPNSSEGRSSGGQIQIATRSGTNEFHGSLREYYRGERFAANTFFNNRNGVERPALQRHQFGGSISGPLPFPNFGENTGPMFRSGRDKLFFFFDYEGRRDDSELAQARTVPLQHLREGRIAYIRATSATTGAACPNTARLDTRPDCIAFLTQADIATLDPAGIGVNQALLSFINSRYPLPNDLIGGNGINTGLFRFNAPVTLSNNTYTPRIDWNITDSQRLFVRATITRNQQTNALELFPGDGDSQRLLDDSYQAVVGHTWAASSSFTNQATVGISRQIWDFPVPDSPAFPNSFGGGGVIDAPFASMVFQDRDVTVPTLRNDSTWTIGTHSIMFGGQFKPIHQKSTLINDFNFVTLGLGGGTTALNSTLRPGNILSSAVTNYDSAFTYLLGRIASLSTRYVFDTEGNVQPLGTGRKRDYVYNEYELYAQDNWKLRSDLTLNLGVRWHFYPAPYEKNGFQSGNDIDFQELVDRRVANAAAGISGLAAEPLLRYNLIGEANDGRPLYEADWNNFAPRVGFAYNPSFDGGFLGTLFGNRKTVIRGGASIVYDRVGGALTFIQDQLGFLFDNLSTRDFGGGTNPRIPLANNARFTGIESLPVTITPPVITRPFTPFVVSGRPVGLEQRQFNYAIAQDFEIPYSYQWSFGVQRELPFNFLLDVSYVGRRGKNLFAQADAAQVLNFREPTSGQFLFDALNTIQPIVQANVLAGRSPATGVTPQPWLENLMNPASVARFGVPCSGLGLGANCTELVANFQPTLVRTGGTADLIQSLAFNRLLPLNVGMSSQFAVNAYITNLGESQYDGMLVSLRKRFSKGFQFDVNYTWSHAIDNNSSVTNTVTTGFICDITNPDACRGDADFDLRHIANVNGIWELPFGRGRAFGADVPGWLDVIIGGWTVSGIFTARSGLPATTETDSFPVGFFVESPAVLIGDRSAFAVNIRDEGTGIQYFADPAAVQAALRYPRHGESGARNIFRSHNYWKIDAVVSKKFKMPWAEGHLLTFRTEAYNLTNTNFFAPPNLLLGSSNFGRITAVQSAPRVIQFGLRYDF